MKDYRKWIEFGKMYDALLKEFGNIYTGEDTNDGYYNVYVVDELGDETYGESDNCLNDAIKDLYFNTILGIVEYDDVDFDLADEDVKKLYEISDEREVPVDEVIMEILSEAVEEYNTSVNEEKERQYILANINNLERSWIDQIPTDQLREYYEVLKKLKPQV